MKRCTLLVLFLGLIAGRTAMGQAIVCAGAEGASTACAAVCSGTIVNDNITPGQDNLGKFNVGLNNQGDGNDGFNNLGSFNIGAGNNGNCNQLSGGTVGFCDVNNLQGQIVLRFCNLLPTDPKCQPDGFLPEFSAALKAQISLVVASCNGGPPAPPLAKLPPPPKTGVVPPTSVPPSVALGPGIAPGSIIPSKTKANPITLLELFTQHLKKEQAGKDDIKMKDDTTKDDKTGRKFL